MRDDGYPELRAWLGEFADLYEDYWPVMRAWTEAELEGTEFGRVGRKVLGQFAGTFVDSIVQSGNDGDVDPEIAALAFVAMIERFHYYVQTRQIDFGREEILDTLSRIAHDGIFARGS